MGCFAPIEFCLTLQTGNKCIFSWEIALSIVWFFGQSKFEKKWNLISRVFEHWKRRTNERWCWQNYFPIEQILLSMEKRSTTLQFCWLLIILLEFPFVFIFFLIFSRYKIIKLGCWDEMKSLLTICWSPSGNLVCLWSKSSSSVIGKKKQKIDSYYFPIDCFGQAEFDLTLKTGNKSIFSMKIIFSDFNFSTNQNSRKNQIQLVEYSSIGNDGWVNTDAGIIIFLLIKSSFRWRNDREDSTFHHYWLF